MYMSYNTEKKNNSSTEKRSNHGIEKKIQL